MTGSGAVVDERVFLLLVQELCDVGGADFHFQSGGDAVEGFHALAGEVLAMLVQVNEAGSDDQAGGVDDAASVQRSRGDAGDFSVADTDVADGVERSFGVEDAAAFEDNVVLLGGGESRGGQKAESQEYWAHGGSEAAMIAGAGDGQK